MIVALCTKSNVVNYTVGVKYPVAYVGTRSDGKIKVFKIYDNDGDYHMMNVSGNVVSSKYKKTYIEWELYDEEERC